MYEKRVGKIQGKTKKIMVGLSWWDYQTTKGHMFKEKRQYMNKCAGWKQGDFYKTRS